MFFIFIFSVFNRLTHIVIPFHKTQSDKVISNLNLWNVLDVCDLKKNIENIDLIFYSSECNDAIMEKNI